MIHGFPDVTLGGLLVVAFIPQAILALAIFALTRPVRRLVVTDRIFANPSLAGLCLYVAILALVMLFY